MRKAVCDRMRDVPFWVLTSLVLVLLLLGLALRVEPSAPEQLGLHLERSLLPLRYLDLVGVGLLLMLIYAALKRLENSRLRGSLTVRDRVARDASREVAELSALFEVSSQMSTFRDIEESLTFIVRTARASLGADRATLLLLEGDELVIRAADGLGGPERIGTRRPIDRGISGWVAREQKPLLLSGNNRVAGFAAGEPPVEDVSSAVCVPLRSGGEVLGVLNVSRLLETGKEPIGEREKGLLTVFADYASSALHQLNMSKTASDSSARLRNAYDELRGVQAQLIQAEKMSAIGQLISEVSHELNSPLTAVVGFAQIVEKLNHDPGISAHLKTIREEGIRCQQIIRNFLDFARKQKGERVEVSLNEIVRDSLALREHQLELDGIEIRLRLDEDLPVCVADPNRLKQVVLNLVNNAHHAVSGNERGKWIAIETGVTPDRDHIEVRVLDNGPGVAPELARRIFDPFFTTKKLGEGTGLGLAVCRGIIQDLGGRIEVGSVPEGGAAFTVRLPAGSEAGVDVPPAPFPEEQARDMRVLVVDDDAKIRLLLAKTLSIDGHRVETAASGEEALSRLAVSEYDLALIDLRMPGMTGEALWTAMRERWPAAARHVVFITGTVLSRQQAQWFEEEGLVCVQKPFRIEDLRAGIGRALARVERAGVGS